MKSLSAEIAFKKGYKVVGNCIISPKGNKRKWLIVGDCRYPRFTIRHGAKFLSIRCHQLAAYQKFGKNVYGDNIEVRHLDDNPKNFRLENIELGLREDNMDDRYINGILQHWIEEVNAEAKEMLESEVPF